MVCHSRSLPKTLQRVNLPRADTTIVKIRNRVPFWEKVVPEGIEIDQNYPNPFRDVTSFAFKLGDVTHVRLSVHDAMGREVAVLTNAEYNRGVHSVVLQGTHLPSGLYFYRFSTEEGIIQRKMLLLR